MHTTLLLSDPSIMFLKKEVIETNQLSQPFLVTVVHICRYSNSGNDAKRSSIPQVQVCRIVITLAGSCDITSCTRFCKSNVMGPGKLDAACNSKGCSCTLRQNLTIST